MKKLFILMLSLLGVAGMAMAQNNAGNNSTEWTFVKEEGGVKLSSANGLCKGKAVTFIKLENTSSEAKTITLKLANAKFVDGNAQAASFLLPMASFSSSCTSSGTSNISIAGKTNLMADLKISVVTEVPENSK